MCLAAANALFVALLLLSGMVFPLDELPSGLRTAAEALPSTALADALRGALASGADVPSRVWPVLVVWAIAAGGARGGAVPLGARRLGGRADGAFATPHVWGLGVDAPAPRPADRQRHDGDQRRRSLSATL